MQATIKEIWTQAKKSNTYLLLSNSYNPSYPVVDDNFSENFITDYKQNHSYYDYYFVSKYADRLPIYLLENDTLEKCITEWHNMVEGLITANLPEFAKMYFATRQKYNPIWNVDGTETERVQGKTEGLSGKDTTTYGAELTEVNLGPTKTTAKTKTVPDDMSEGQEKLTDTNIVEGIQVHNENKVNEHKIDVDFGKTNNVYYTTTRTRGGNIGVTKTQELINAQSQVVAFYDYLFSKIANTLTIWG